MKKKFQIEYIGTPEFEKRFLAELLPYQGNQDPIVNIRAMISQPPLNCLSVVFECGYVDADYQDEFAAFYAKSFKKYPQRCTRLHFFSKRIRKTTRFNFAKYRDSYLGFMVVRPTDLQRVGRTVIRPPISDHNAEFLTCHAKFETHILGTDFTVDGMPFIQQDTQVGACAQACLWMLSRLISTRFHHRVFFPAEINLLAKAKMGLGRHFPAENGLTLSQMLEALNGMGLSAIAYQRHSIDAYSPHINLAFPVTETGEKALPQLNFQRTAKLADIAYRYIESGLPVIFGTCDHALVGVGHTYTHNTNATVALQRIPEFIVNNDNTGCYCKMPILTTGAKYNFCDVDVLMAVTPPEATLRGEMAESMAATYIKKFLSLKTDVGEGKMVSYQDILSQWRPDFALWLGQLEFRTYLQPSIDLQRDLWLELKRKILKRSVALRLLSLDYPKYVWVTEVSTPTLLNKPDKKDRRCLGRVFVDSTAPANTSGTLAMHFADCLSIEDREGTDHEFLFCPLSTPFEHKLW